MSILNTPTRSSESEPENEKKNVTRSKALTAEMPWVLFSVCRVMPLTYGSATNILYYLKSSHMQVYAFYWIVSLFLRNKVKTFTTLKFLFKKSGIAFEEKCILIKDDNICKDMPRDCLLSMFGGALKRLMGSLDWDWDLWWGFWNGMNSIKYCKDLELWIGGRQEFGNKKRRRWHEYKEKSI